MDKKCELCGFAQNLTIYEVLPIKKQESTKVLWHAETV
jgi:hypothetical protein